MFLKLRFKHYGKKMITVKETLKKYNIAMLEAVF